MRRLALAAAILALASSNVRAAARTVALIGVSGPRGEGFAAELAASLEELYEVVPGARYLATAARLHAQSAAPEAVRAVASALHVDGVIAGSVGGGRLRIVVRDGTSGEVLQRTDYPLRSRNLSSLREKVIADLVRDLERVGRPARPAPAPAVARRPQRPPVLDDPRRDESDNAPSREDTEGDEPSQARRPTVRESSESDGEGEPDLSITRSAPSRSRDLEPAIVVGVGLALVSRSLSFDTDAAPGQSGGAITALDLRGTVFPLALAPEVARAHPVAAAFGLTASWQRSLGITATGSPTTTFASGATSAARASRWRVLLVGRIPLGRGGATLDVESGLASLNYAFDSSRDLGLPDVGYQALDGGLSLRLPLGTRRVMLSARVAGLAIVDAGPIASDAQYGQGAGAGVDLDGVLEAWVTPWLWLRAGAGYTRLDMSYGGSGMRFARSSTDGWLEGLIEVGSAL